MKIMKILALGAIFLAAGCAKKSEKGEMTIEKGKLKMAASLDYSPFEYYEGDKPAGFDIDLTREIAKRLGLEAEIISNDFEGLFAGLDAGRFDMSISAITVIPERQKRYFMSIPYIGNVQTILVNSASKKEINDIKDLTGMHIGYQISTTSNFFVDELVKKENLTVQTNSYDVATNAFSDLAIGRIDAVVVDSLVAATFIKKAPESYKIAWEGNSNEVLAVALAKDNVKLGEKVNEVISEMMKDGSMKALYEKHFGMDMSYTIK